MILNLQRGMCRLYGHTLVLFTIFLLQICGGTAPMLDPSESRTMVLVKCNSTAQWQNKVLNRTV